MSESKKMMEKIDLLKEVIKFYSILLLALLQINFSTIKQSSFRGVNNLRPLDVQFNTQKIKYNQEQMEPLHLSEEESPQRVEQNSSSQHEYHSPRDNINEKHLLNLQHTPSKNKSIRKTASKGSKASKERRSQKGEDSSNRSKDDRSKDDRSKNDRKMGRPNKDPIDKEHTELSKKFNDIIYCSSRFLIFFYLMKGKDEKTVALTYTKDQSDWLFQANHIMRQDNFPSIQNRSVPFLLHPNSLHFIIHYNKVNKNERSYDPQRIKYYLFACLDKKNLLTPTIWMYVSQYWADIIQLINNWRMAASRQRSFVGRQKNYVEYQKEEDQDKGTVESMREEFEKDPSIAAHEIAAYLWACCQHFDIQIRPNQPIND